MRTIYSRAVMAGNPIFQKKELFGQIRFDLLGHGYGLPGIASEIHCQGRNDALRSAMVCRESLLRYTSTGNCKALPRAMVCRESLLRYTGGRARPGAHGLWFSGNSL